MVATLIVHNDDCILNFNATTISNQSINRKTLTLSDIN